FGLAPTISVGNLVFKDVDNSGTYDSSIDAPLGGVTLQLFAQGADPLSSTPVATAVTGGGGLYLFSVRAGNYFIYTPASQFTSTGVLSGMKPARGRTDNTVPNIDDTGDQNALATSKPIATGVRTGVFTLASGVMPTAASGETGHLANSDSAYDSDANLTVDLGFYLLPTVTAPLAGRVTRDLSGTGDPTTATSPLPGVEVALYEDLNGNGKLDPEEMTAVDTQVTSGTGAYVFDAVPSGDYIVVQSVLPGAEATFDSDGGDADATAITVEGDPIVEVDFLQALSPDTFIQWQQLHTGISNTAADNPDGDNPDGDLASNLLEYALGTEPGSGADKRHFWLEANASGPVDAVIVRYTTGHKDVTYALEGSNDLTAWSNIASTPFTTSNADGTETLRYAGLTSAFVRLKVSLDANHDGTAEATATSQVQSWTRHTFTVGSQTFSMPLLKAEVFSGKAGMATGAAFIPGQSYYAEVIGGDGEGLRFEVNEAKSSATSIAYEAAAPAADARLVVRAHWTLRDVFPVTLFHAGTSSSNADRVMFFNGTGYNVYWLLARPAGSRWVRDGDASLADAGATVVGPLDGLMVNPRAASVAVTYAGAVRSWKAALSLHAGAQLVGSGYPLVLSPNDRAMNGANGFASSDSFRLWLGDSSASSAYASFSFNQPGALGSYWSADDGHDVGVSKLFDAYHAAWIISTAGSSSWKPSVPWQP
ncbi:MAG: conserved repeat domain protein, partial [Verrucomicrobiaceae bacterium]|nr:conserved repeat domain protein [Verrucomicrobiaceae bacterium]